MRCENLEFAQETLGAAITRPREVITVESVIKAVARGSSLVQPLWRPVGWSGEADVAVAAGAALRWDSSTVSDSYSQPMTPVRLDESGADALMPDPGLTWLTHPHRPT